RSMRRALFLPRRASREGVRVSWENFRSKPSRPSRRKSHQHLRDFLLDGLDGFERKFSHVVEKALAAQLRGIGGEQSIENRPRVPVGQLRLGCGSQAAVENGQQGVLPYGESLVSF